MEVVFITFVKPPAWISNKIVFIFPFLDFLNDFTTIQVHFGVKGYFTIHIGRCHVTLIEETIGFLNLLGI